MRVEEMEKSGLLAGEEVGSLEGRGGPGPADGPAAAEVMEGAKVGGVPAVTAVGSSRVRGDLAPVIMEHRAGATPPVVDRTPGTPYGWRQEAGAGGLWGAWVVFGSLCDGGGGLGPGPGVADVDEEDGGAGG